MDQWPPDLSNIPIQPPPPGLVSEFNIPRGSVTRVIGVMSLLLFLSTAFLMIRLYTRFWIVRALDHGDSKTLHCHLLFATTSDRIHKRLIAVGLCMYTPISTTIPHPKTIRSDYEHWYRSLPWQIQLSHSPVSQLYQSKNA